MHRYLMASVAALAFGIGAASAADLSPAAAPVYTKAPVAVPFSWTGFYLGGNVGYGWGTANGDPSFSQTDATNPTATFSVATSDKINGVIGGAQAGYNWQINDFVLGLETDIQASGQKGTDTFAGLITSSVVNNPAAGTGTSKLDWFGTTRGRLGFAIDHWLVYETGGVAYGEVNQTGTIQPANENPGLGGPPQNAPIVWNQSSTKVGWTAGAGVENAINRNWSWKLEYLYMDLGTASANTSGGIGTAPPHVTGNCYASSLTCFYYRNGATGTATSHFTDNILRVGVNYRFN